MKLNGWKRIGIIASFVWMTGACVYTFRALSYQDLKTAQFFYSQCAKTRNEGSQNARENCWHKSEIPPMIDSSRVFNQCMEDYDATHPDRCSADSEKYAVNALPGERIAAALAAIVPVPFAWGLAYLVLFLVGWVKRGFAK